MIYNKVFICYEYSCDTRLSQFSNYRHHQGKRNIVVEYNKPISNEKAVDELLLLANKDLLKQLEDEGDIDIISMWLINFKRLESSEES